MINQVIVDFVQLAVDEKRIDEQDKVYITNKILALLKKDDFDTTLQASDVIDNRLILLDQLLADAIARGVITDMAYEKYQLGASLMDLLTPLPSVLNQTFWHLYKDSPESATDYFYQLSQDNDYIKTRDIARNIAFSYPSQYGDLAITINLSKPEKDSKQIALEKTKKQTGYPISLLAVENEGYYGRINHPARTNHRLIHLDVTNEKWALQYSPYAYYNEHCIFLSEVIKPMKITRDTLKRLLEIVTVFPHYFVGSNADLPIVGGSILVHDHYQGGRHTFPMEKAAIEKEVHFTGFEDVHAGIVKWPMSVIRLTAENPERLEALAYKIMLKWADYSDESVDIISQSNGEAHNTITPIARRIGKQYQLDIVLRNNRTTTLFPDGIFHPHQDVQHIKKENIGLIEVMGLAILPPRLKDELAVIEDFIAGKVLNVAPMHQQWAEDLKANKPADIAVHAYVQQAVGEKFARVLEDAGVYKVNEEGRKAFMRFIDTINE